MAPGRSGSSLEPRRIGTAFLTISLVLSLLIAGVAPAAAQSQGDEPALVVAVEESGAAELTLILVFDLSEDADRQAFESIQTDDATLETVSTRFNDRMDAVASATGDRVNRNVTASDPKVTVETRDGGETGIVRLAVTMTDLAAAEDDRVVLTEPFASGFESDRTLIVRPPDGYTIASTTPAPDDQVDGEAHWDPSTSFDEFEVAFEPDPSSRIATPGLGTLAAIGVVAIVGLLLWRRR